MRRMTFCPKLRVCVGTLIQWNAPGSLGEDCERAFTAVLSYVLEIVHQLQERAPSKHKLRFLAGEQSRSQMRVCEDRGSALLEAEFKDVGSVHGRR